MSQDNTSRVNFDRRSLLKAGGIGSVTVLAGCLGGDPTENEGGEGSTALMDIEEVPTDDYEEELNVWNWYVQWAEWASETFSEEFDVNPTVEGYSQPSQWFSQLQSGNHDIDHIGTTAEWAGRASESGFLAEIPAERLPNWEHLDSAFTDPIVENLSGENGGVYAVPHSINIFPALVYNNEYFDSEPNSWDILWDEEFADQMALMVHYSSAAGALGALYTGQDPNDPDDFEEIEEVLINQKDLVVTYASEHESHMQSFINEEVILGTHTSGRINIANFSHDADHVSWTVPEEGSLFGTDSIVIPADAPHPRATLNFLNYVISEDSFREFVDIMNYKVPHEDIESLLSDDDRIDDELIEVIQWNDIDVDNLHWNGPLDDEVEERYDEIWTNVQAA